VLWGHFYNRSNSASHVSHVGTVGRPHVHSYQCTYDSADGDAIGGSDFVSYRRANKVTHGSTVGSTHHSAHNKHDNSHGNDNHGNDDYDGFVRAVCVQLALRGRVRVGLYVQHLPQRFHYERV